MSSIPASEIVNVIPGVLNAGGSALALNGVILTQDPAVPIGTVKSFPTADTVSAFFGPSSQEAALAAIYFRGANNATKVPGALFFAQYAASAVAGYLRGASLAGMTLTQLQALSGILTVTVNGTAKTSSSINLSAATSFSNAATIIAAGFTSLGATVAYDSVRQAFTFTSSTTGNSSSVSFASNSLSAGLKLTQATGAVLSSGSDVMTPGTAMDSVKAATQNWATFMTVFEPIVSDKVAFSKWTNDQLNRFAYVGWDTDGSPTTTVPATSCWMYQVTQAGYSGSCPLYLAREDAAFVLGLTASLDFARTNGRKAFAFKNLDGLTPTVTDAGIAANLEANGYNYIGNWATANDDFTFLYPGTVSGPFGYMTKYVNQIYFNSQLQLALMNLLTTINSVPYNNQGYALIQAACADPINEALNFGTIRAGVTLSDLQIAEVNNAAGQDIANTLQTRGWYLQVKDPTPQVRQAGGTPVCTLWYTDGGDVLKITLASIAVL